MGPEYLISVAAQLANLHPQTLRTWDRLGLVQPGRTAGNGRRYSDQDVQRLVTVAQLSAEGLSLEGIRRVLELTDQVDALRRRISELEQQLAGGMQASRGNEIIPLPQSAVIVWRKR